MTPSVPDPYKAVSDAGPLSNADRCTPIRVNAVRAGAIRTPMWTASPPRDAIFASLARRTLVGTVGEPEQIAMAHLYLMHNDYVTGTTLAVDGGSLLTAK